MTRARYAAGLALASALVGAQPGWADGTPSPSAAAEPADAAAHPGPALCAPGPSPTWFDATEPPAPAWPMATLLSVPTTASPSIGTTPPLQAPQDDFPPIELAAATLAGLGLVGALGWRLGRIPALPWHPTSDEPSFAVTNDNHDAAGWRLSRFDDLPEAEPVKALRPLYDSLDDVIDVVPLTRQR